MNEMKRDIEGTETRNGGTQENIKYLKKHTLIW